MPTRKQRRRREKTFRHDYDFVTYDEEGNEIEVDPSQLRPAKEKPEKPAAKARGTGGRALREPPKPSWQRALKRGGIWGGLMVLVIIVFFKGQSIASRVAVGVLYAVAFI